MIGREKNGWVAEWLNWDTNGKPTAWCAEGFEDDSAARGTLATVVAFIHKQRQSDIELLGERDAQDIRYRAYNIWTKQEVLF